VTEEIHKNSVRIVCVPAEIQTRHLPTTSQKHPHLAAFLGSMNNLVIILSIP
jgi:hypothetical protein